MDTNQLAKMVMDLSTELEKALDEFKMQGLDYGVHEDIGRRMIDEARDMVDPDRLFMAAMTAEYNKVLFARDNGPMVDVLLQESVIYAAFTQAVINGSINNPKVVAAQIQMMMGREG